MGGGKRRGAEGPSTAGRAANQAVSLREESSGRALVDEASLLRVKHLHRLAAWAGAETGVGPVGALLGRRLAASAEIVGVPLGAATFLCQRCETILKPGFNCTVRIRSKRNKTKRRKKSNCCQNSVAYACHFCGDQNLILGSGKGVVKSLLSSRKQASMDSTRRSCRRNESNTRTPDLKEVPGHSQAAILQVDSSSRLTQLTSERVEQGERLKLDLCTDCKMDEGAALSSVESGHLAISAFEDGSIQKIVIENATDGNMHETEPVSLSNSSKKVETCEASATLEAEFMVGSEFVTPKKSKLMNSAEPFSTKNTKSKKGEASNSVAKTLSSSCKSFPNDSHKRSKSATGDAAQVSSSSRKRVRRGWTTLKQIAEKDEIERKEKMDNFVIPFFM